LTYFFAGTSGDEIHAMDSTTGQRLWARPREGLLYASPTINAENVFYQTSTSLDILDYRSGATVASIVHPAAGSETASVSLVALGSRGNALVNSYETMTTRKPLSSFDIAGRRWQWTTQYPYFSLFAVADGVIYANRNRSPPTLDAIDETTGQVLWSWSPPAIDAQVEPVGNVLLTRNMVFVSTLGNTTSWVWAIDRATHQVAWRYPGGGNLAISGSRTLLVQTGPVGADSYDTLRAFRIAP
jgi:outer membrane protein assembly factor BamB